MENQSHIEEERLIVILTLSLPDNLHTFYRLLIFFQNHFFEKSFGEPSECKTVWIQKRPDVKMWGLIKIQTVFKFYQQMAIVGKELIQGQS